MRMALLALPVLLMGCSCHKEIADGITTAVSPGGDVWIRLETNKSILIKTATGFFSVCNLDGVLNAIEVEDGNPKTPFSVTLISPTQQMVTIERQTGDTTVLLMDQDGDGIPDKKLIRSVDGKTVQGYRIKSIEWENIQEQKE